MLPDPALNLAFRCHRGADGRPIGPKLVVIGPKTRPFLFRFRPGDEIAAVKVKLEWARQFGATHTINSRHTDPVQAIRDLTGGNGVTVAIEAVGRPETYAQAFYARDHAGTGCLVLVEAVGGERAQLEER